MLPHALRTGRGELHVVGLGPARVGVALDADRHCWPRFQYVADLVEQSEAARLDRRLVGVEEVFLLELDLLRGADEVRVLLGAPSSPRRRSSSNRRSSSTPTRRRS